MLLESYWKSCETQAQLTGGHAAADLAVHALKKTSRQLQRFSLESRRQVACRPTGVSMKNSSVNLFAMYSLKYKLFIKMLSSSLNNIVDSGQTLQWRLLWQISGATITSLHVVKIGHSRLTHSYLQSGEDQPTCAFCDGPLTVKHTLVDCPDLQDIRQKYFIASSLKDIFEIVDSQYITGFIFIFTVNCSICYPFLSQPYSPDSNIT